MPEDTELGDDFAYILRMADSDVDGLKPIAIGLTSIKGVGMRTSQQICRLAGINGKTLGGHLSEEEQDSLRSAIDDYATTVPWWLVNRQRDLADAFPRCRGSCLVYGVKFWRPEPVLHDFTARHDESIDIFRVVERVSVDQQRPSAVESQPRVATAFSQGLLQPGFL